MKILESIKKSNGKKLAVLIDPAKERTMSIKKKSKEIENSGADYIFIGGSLTGNDIEKKTQAVKEVCSLPIILFPGNILQITNKADALLLLSLISGRNPELLIGQHVAAAVTLKESDLEVISTGYMLIEGEQKSAVEYISNTNPIPANKPEIAVATAIAGEMIGLKLIYLEAGSGAIHPVSPEIITAVKRNTALPLIVGGGIKTTAQLKKTCKAGADIIVVGNLFEKSTELMHEFACIVHEY